MKNPIEEIWAIRREKYIAAESKINRLTPYLHQLILDIMPCAEEKSFFRQDSRKSIRKEWVEFEPNCFTAENAWDTVSIGFNLKEDPADDKDRRIDIYNDLWNKNGYIAQEVTHGYDKDENGIATHIRIEHLGRRTIDYNHNWNWSQSLDWPQLNDRRSRLDSPHYYGKEKEIWYEPRPFYVPSILQTANKEYSANVTQYSVKITQALLSGENPVNFKTELQELQKNHNRFMVSDNNGRGLLHGELTNEKDENMLETLRAIGLAAHKKELAISDRVPKNKLRELDNDIVALQNRLRQQQGEILVAAFGDKQAEKLLESSVF